MKIATGVVTKFRPLNLFLFIFYYALMIKDEVVCLVVPTLINDDLFIISNLFENLQSFPDPLTDSNLNNFNKGVNKVDAQGATQKRGLRDKRFVIMIDAGSSGSRIFVYEYYFKPNPSSRYVSVQDLVIDLALDSRGNHDPLTRRIYPGLSSYSKNSSMAAEYLFKLIDSVINLIPPQYLPGTPLYILATAGLRLLQEEQRHAILEDCRRDISSRYPLLYFPPHHVAIISGEMEGTYAWISVNYILGNFHKQHLSDMGGASLQIAYEVPAAYTPTTADSKTLLKSGVTDLIKFVDLSDYPPTDAMSKQWIYKLYVASFLGFGANEAINTYRQSILDKFVYQLKAARFLYGSKQEGIKATTLPKLPIQDPCYPKGLAYNLTGTFQVPIKIGDQTKFKGYAVTLPILGTGNFKKCQIALLPLLNLQKACLIKPCSLKGYHHPPQAYPNSKFYAVSEFWYTSQNIKAFLGPYNSKIFGKKAEAVCKSKKEDMPLRSDDKNLEESQTYVPKATDRCAKASWISIILHRGFNFPPGNPKVTSIEFVSTIGGRDVQWTFGAAISEIFKDRRTKRK